MSTTITELCDYLQQLLIEDAERIGRESGFIQRKRKLSGASFAQGLVFGFQSNVRASLDELCQSLQVCGVSISAQGLQDRMDERGAQFLKQMFEQALTYVVESSGKASDILSQFNGVYLQDSSILSLPLSLIEVWQGSGNQNGGSSSIKLQTMLDYQQGRLSIHLAHGRQSDQKLQSLDLPEGALRLNDMGYFSFKVLGKLTQTGVYWITRLPASVNIWHEGKLIPLATWLAQQNQSIIDVEVELSAQKFKCRLIAVLVPDEVVQQRRERTLAQMKDSGRKVRSETLQLCQWTVIVTNLQAQQLRVDEALVILRIRWQIELTFKLWKSSYDLHEWRSQQPQQILCEVYAKLLLIVIQHWLLLVGCWQQVDRSLFKATRVLCKHAFHLATVLYDADLLALTLQSILARLTRCKVQKRRKRPAAFQLLARGDP